MGGGIQKHYCRDKSEAILISICRVNLVNVQ